MFMGAPVPTRGNNASEFSAKITMAYFRPWTLRSDSEEKDVVPYAGSLRKDSESWEYAFRNWLDGHILSQESMKYIGIFLSVSDSTT